MMPTGGAAYLLPHFFVKQTMAQIEYKELLDAGVHFGHLTRKWDPRMAPYIFMEKNGIHIIDLNKTQAALEEASNALKGIVRSGRKVLFVATKKQAQEIVSEEARRLKMPYVTDRWQGGMLTNFATIRKSLKKMQTLEKMLKDEETVKSIAKRERLTKSRDKEKLERVLGGIADLTRLPAALFVVDVKREHIAVSEAHRLGIPVFAMCDTNSNPEEVDFAIPANDDAYKSISLITLAIGKAIEEGLTERKQDKDDQRVQEEEEAKRQSDMAQAKSEGEDQPVAVSSPAAVAEGEQEA
jgi:small subunit ribosomal protein S2